MPASRLWMLIPALLLVAAPIDADAQGRGRGPKAKQRNGNGPAFCRSGAGHPVHGWEWCRDKGWDRADRDRGWSERDDERDDRDRGRDRENRDRDRRLRTSRFPWPF
jgi:hypothetical protein